MSEEQLHSDQVKNTRDCENERHTREKGQEPTHPSVRSSQVRELFTVVC